MPENNHYLVPSELKTLLNESFETVFLLDIRPNKIFDKSHIEGAINIFLKDLFKEENIKKLPFNKTIIVCCGIGHLASQALVLLQLLGYNAIGLKYGMGITTVEGEIQKGWGELGYTVKTGSI
jgi:rhodanese-related sulfurtransferase